MFHRPIPPLHLMAGNQRQRGGSSEPPAEAGRQSHKKPDDGRPQGGSQAGGAVRSFSGIAKAAPRRIASLGGKAARESGQAHARDSEEAPAGER